MMLVNQLNGMKFPMTRSGPYRGLSGELAIAGRKASRSWTVRIKIPEAVLVLAPAVLVVAASRHDRIHLRHATLSIKFDGETAAEFFPLLGPHQPVPPAHGKTYWLMAEDLDRPRGVFLVDGAVVEALVRLPAAPRSTAKIAIQLAADLYSLKASPRQGVIRNRVSIPFDSAP